MKTPSWNSYISNIIIYSLWLLVAISFSCGSLLHTTLSLKRHYHLLSDCYRMNYNSWFCPCLEVANLVYIGKHKYKKFTGFLWISDHNRIKHSILQKWLMLKVPHLTLRSTPDDIFLMYLNLVLLLFVVVLLFHTDG